jgi:transcription elongation factor Elf1
MVKLALQLKANLDNVTDFRIASPNDFIWYLKFDCAKCHTQSETYHDINSQQSSSISGSRGEANFLMKCKFCSQEGNLNIESMKPPVNYTSDDSDNHVFKTIVIFDCRGIEPVDWQPGRKNGLS